MELLVITHLKEVKLYQHLKQILYLTWVKVLGSLTEFLHKGNLLSLSIDHRKVLLWYQSQPHVVLALFRV